jgi:hypothetical protein
VPQQLAIFKVASRTQTFFVKEQGDKFDVTTLDGLRWMSVVPEAGRIVWNARKHFKDAKGNIVFDFIQKGFPHQATTFAVVENNSKKEHMRLRKKFSCEC